MYRVSLYQLLNQKEIIICAIETVKINPINQNITGDLRNKDIFMLSYEEAIGSWFFKFNSCKKNSW